MPVCEICGRDSHDGSKCHACQSAIWHGYRMDVDDISGSKIFQCRDTNHFVTGYRAACRSLLLKRMSEVGPDRGQS